MTTSRLDRIVCYGDSQTAGFSWGPKMVALSDTLTEAIGRGVSGQEAGSVAIRQGGIVLKTTAACTIPASTDPVIVPVQASVTPCNIRSSSSATPVVLAGVRGVATVINADLPEGMPSANRATGVFTIEFVPDSAPSEEVSVPSGTPFVSQDVADHPDWGDSLHIIWVGGNDSAFAGATRVTGVVSAVTAMVDRLRTIVDEPKFLVASRTVYASEVEGTSGYATAVAQRDALKAAFPDNAIDIWGHVRDNGLSILGIEPTEEDRTSLAGGAIPRSLTADGIHYTTETREQVLAPFIVSELAARGWTTESEEEEPAVAFTPKNDWKAGDYYKADRIIELEATVAANAAAATTAAAAKESADAAAQGVSDLRETKADKTALDGMVPNTGTKTVAGTTTFTGNTTFSGPTAFTASNRFGATAVAADVVADETTPLFTRFNTTTGVKKFTLAAGVMGGRRYIVGRSYQGSNPLQIIPPTGGTINNSAEPYIIANQGEMAEIVSLGSAGAWHVVSHDKAPTWDSITGKPTIPDVTPAGTRAQLDAGTDTTVRAFSAKDIADYVAAQIAAAANTGK